MNYIFKAVYKISDSSASVPLQCAKFSKQIFCILDFAILRNYVIFQNE